MGEPLPFKYMVHVETNDMKTKIIWHLICNINANMYLRDNVVISSKV